MAYRSEWYCGQTYLYHCQFKTFIDLCLFGNSLKLLYLDMQAKMYSGFACEDGANKLID